MAENEAGIEEVELDDARVEAIRAAVEAGDDALVLRLMEPLHAADIADFLEQIDQRERRDFLAIYAGEIDGDLLSEIDETIREEVIESLPVSVVAEAVRALAARDLTASNARRVVLRELAAGAMNGVALAVVIGLAGWGLFGDPWIGAVLAAAMIVNQIVAALGGVLVPLTMDRMGLDPALASGTFVTTLTDVMGFLAFLGFATLVLI